MLILASTSSTRASLLRSAGVEVEPVPPRVDEDAIKASLIAEGTKPRDIADALAEAKAHKVAFRLGQGFVLGCDQVAEVGGEMLSKPKDKDEARAQLMHLRDRQHVLHSAAVIYEGHEPVWRIVATARLRMRAFSEDWLDGYIDRNWESIRHSVGGYRLEEEGARLFASIQGDYFTILGLPLLDVLGYLTLRGELRG